MSRLWDRGQSVDERIVAFTVGRDPELDRRLVACDALASAAHATMLESIGVLGEDELSGLLRELAAAARDAREGRFEITVEDEDGHTALENRLTRRLGDAGRRIHTGRSRNDQVIAAVRVWTREILVDQLEALLTLVGRLLDLAEEHRETSLPGYTHTRQAMPSTLGFLFAAYAENLLDDVPWLETAFRHADRSPLGSASGYGVALPLDRPLVQRLLGFAALQHNTLAVQNDRGKTEYLVLGAALAPAVDLGRLASDLIFFSTEELGCIKLDERVTTGSSIMPQKRNPDVLELTRANSAVLHSCLERVLLVAAKLPSSYHRDYQLTKAPLLQGLRLVRSMSRVMELTVSGLSVDAERARAGVLPEAYATHRALELVRQGVAFREAYRAVGQGGGADTALETDPRALYAVEGSAGRLELERARERVAALRGRSEEARGALMARLTALESGGTA
ncbi:MAG: argininosuccinate lyase [Acidobacteria bacterium]|nr:argininosuccinate lyase [Acidobacteriota bacterium]